MTIQQDFAIANEMHGFGLNLHDSCCYNFSGSNFWVGAIFCSPPTHTGGRQMGSDANMASPLSKGCGSQLNKDIEKE